MRFPVYFLPLEKELAPIISYLRGRVLNAGCGNRDVSEFLRAHYATHVDNCDVQSSLPNAIICDLQNIPHEDCSYDAILCNAVLEHLPNPIRAMKEFHRLLKPSGALIVSVPFLQPFHADPHDFRRYTYSGLIQLGELTGFRIIRIDALHTMAQTIGWLVWAYFEERRSLVGKLLSWLPIYLASRLFTKPMKHQMRTANSFRAVMEKR